MCVGVCAPCLHREPPLSMISDVEAAEHLWGGDRSVAKRAAAAAAAFSLDPQVSERREGQDGTQHTPRCLGLGGGCSWWGVCWASTCRCVALCSCQALFLWLLGAACSECGAPPPTTHTSLMCAHTHAVDCPCVPAAPASLTCTPQHAELLAGTRTPQQYVAAGQALAGVSAPLAAIATLLAQPAPDAATARSEPDCT